MKASRRNFLQGGIIAATGWLSGKAFAATPQQEHSGNEHHPAKAAPRAPAHSAGSLGAGIVPVETPDVPKLPWTMDGRVKVFNLVAEPVKQEFLPGQTFDLWGYNGSAPGPTIEVNQGDRVRIVVDNHLPEFTSMHWHGFEIPVEMDGAPGISQEPIPPGGRFIYEFTLHQAGTFFYHSHMPMQEMIGMIGLFIMHPKEPYRPRVDKDFGIILQEYAILPNNTVPNTMSMEFNWLTLNGKTGPACTPMIVRQGDRVRIRVINLGMDHHPIHLHGNTFYVTGTEGGRIPEAAWIPGNTALVGVAEARDIEFDAKYPGDWMVHCHMPHHNMNQMSSMVGPMTRMPGMTAGKGMEEGMGIMHQGGPASEENGPSLGRGMGVGSTSDQAVANGPVSVEQAQHAGHGMQHHHHQGFDTEVAKNANSVPGFPQDAMMEGPGMAIDELVEKPETYGLPKGWSGYSMGMMTLVRVLPPETYDKIMALKNQRR